MQDWINQLGLIVELSKKNLPFTLMIIAIFWAIHIVNITLKRRLNILGIYPRHPFGLIGIPCSPFLHGNFEHLLFNSIPLFILSNLVLLYGHQVFFAVSGIIILLGGLAVWLVGRQAIHIGASGLIMGYWGFLLMQAVHAPNATAVILAAVVLYYLGGMVTSLLPSGKGVSWESHVFGFLAGVACVYILPMMR